MSGYSGLSATRADQEVYNQDRRQTNSAVDGHNRASTKRVSRDLDQDNQTFRAANNVFAPWRHLQLLHGRQSISTQRLSQPWVPTPPEGSGHHPGFQYLPPRITAFNIHQSVHLNHSGRGAAPLDSPHLNLFVPSFAFFGTGHPFNPSNHNQAKPIAPTASWGSNSRLESVDRHDAGGPRAPIPPSRAVTTGRIERDRKKKHRWVALRL